MARTADVKSLDAIEQVRSAMCLFAEEVDQALTGIRAQVQDFVHWLKEEQLGVWKHQIRVREEKVLEAKADLSRCLSATIDPNRTPTCYQEKKILAAAKRSLAEAEEKLAAVKRWIPIVDQAVSDYFARAETMATAVVVDVPQAVAHLDRLLSALVEYQQVMNPSAEGVHRGAAEVAEKRESVGGFTHVAPSPLKPAPNQSEIDSTATTEETKPADPTLP